MATCVICLEDAPGVGNVWKAFPCACEIVVHHECLEAYAAASRQQCVYCRPPTGPTSPLEARIANPNLLIQLLIYLVLCIMTIAVVLLNLVLVGLADRLVRNADGWLC